MKSCVWFLVTPGIGVSHITEAIISALQWPPYTPCSIITRSVSVLITEHVDGTEAGIYSGGRMKSQFDKLGRLTSSNIHQWRIMLSHVWCCSYVLSGRPILFMKSKTSIPKISSDVLAFLTLSIIHVCWMLSRRSYFHLFLRRRQNLFCLTDKRNNFLAVFLDTSYPLFSFTGKQRMQDLQTLLLLNVHLLHEMVK